MPYTMRIHTKKNTVGHFIVEFDDGDGGKYFFGFGPESRFSGALSLASPVQGMMDDKSKKPNEEDFLASDPVTLTKEQYEQALLYRDHYEKLVNEGRIKYEANGNNCIRFAGSLLNSIGSKENLDDILSDEQKDLVNLANASIDPARTAVNAAKTAEQVALAQYALPLCTAATLGKASPSLLRSDGVDVKEQIKNIGECTMQKRKRFNRPDIPSFGMGLIGPMIVQPPPRVMWTKNWKPCQHGEKSILTLTKNKRRTIYETSLALVHPAEGIGITGRSNG